jgi:hypothetical protein
MDTVLHIYIHRLLPAVCTRDPHRHGSHHPAQLRRLAFSIAFAFSHIFVNFLNRLAFSMMSSSFNYFCKLLN